MDARSGKGIFMCYGRESPAYLVHIPEREVMKEGMCEILEDKHARKNTPGRRTSEKNSCLKNKNPPQ